MVRYIKQHLPSTLLDGALEWQRVTATKKLVHCSPRTRMGRIMVALKVHLFLVLPFYFHLCFLALLRSCSQCLWAIAFNQVKVKVAVTELCLTLCDPMDCTVLGILQARILERSPSPGDLPNPGIELKSPALWAESLPAEPQRKPKSTGVGSLSLCQWIFPTQELNRECSF